MSEQDSRMDEGVEGQSVFSFMILDIIKMKHFADLLILKS